MGKQLAFVASVAAVLSGSALGGAATGWADPGDPVVGQACSDPNQVSGSMATGPLICPPDSLTWTPEPELGVVRSQTLGDRCGNPDGTTTNAVNTDNGRTYLAMCYQGTWTKYHQ